MPRTFTVSDSIVVHVRPADVYRHVSDPARMGDWSPENLGATVHGGAAGETRVGTVFDGRNKRGAFRWTTRCTVTAVEKDRLFRFRVHAIGIRRPRIPGPIATWEYRFESVPEGTRVTETWTDDRRSWPDFAAHAFDRVATRGHTFADFQRRNISTTLRNLKKALEPASDSA
ncbi:MULTISPECIES: SRPBCC family protein [unclassified Streptomyces]|uniref:SRPBCC family protein n=1 Tax=unclassified Streptomyces TaxID=2593676 RepID=UPI00214CA433|nr:MULTISPECIES: SRPBCC family protein [unclassified Streptomyces]MCX5015422.1 SRPBCC family protein [Streptomyces sp. NBC_00555]MCX5609945.1 SRPBCC family protein [Streptomyces sp. NBC_00047]UUU43831.1 SRPBCC family protein [Streptomyces sp. NBC_00162]